MSQFFDFAAFFGLAVVDSINPSAIAMSIFLLAKNSNQKAIKNMFFYLSGVYFTYFTIGLLLVLGLNYIVNYFSDFFESREAYYVQLVIGATMFVWSLFESKKKEGVKTKNVDFSSNIKLFLIGIAITMAELVTAIPYFGAIALLQHSGMSLPIKIISLLVYNLIFILPPLIILATYIFRRKKFDDWLQRRREKNKGKPTGENVKWVVGIIGFLVAANAISVLRYS